MKGEYCNGSQISKSIHPIPEVEIIKQNLLQRKKLKDIGICWELRCNLRIGLLMAVNLNSGILLKESPYKQNVVVSHREAAELKGKFCEKQICVTDSDIIMKSIRSTQKLVSINSIEINSSIFTHHGSDTFGNDEKFVLNILRNKGILSPFARHGIASKGEADIVDENTREQFEIIYEFKTSLSKKKMKPNVLFNPEMQIIQLVDNPFIHTSNALENKLKKDYNTQYSSNLVILTLGNEKAVASMIESLSKKIAEDNKSHIKFASIYIISLNFISETAIFARISGKKPFEIEEFPCKNEELGFVKLTPIEFSSINDESEYLIICSDLFDGTIRCRYDSGIELRKWVKEINMWGIPN